MVVKKNKSKKKPSRPIRHKKPMKTIKKERYNKKSKQIRKKKSSRGVKKRTKKVNVMRGGGLFDFSTSKTASTYTYGIKFLILPDKDTLDSEFIKAIPKDLIGIVLYIPIETFGNKTYYTLYKGFKIYYNKEKGSDLKIHIQNEKKKLDITINIMINITELTIMSITYNDKKSITYNDKNIFKDHNITLYGNINAGNSIYYKKDKIKYTNKQILNEISKGTLKTFGEIIIEDNFSDITKYYSNPNLHSILNYFLKDYMIFKGIKLPYYITNPYDFKYDLEKLLNLLFYYDSTKKNIDFTEQNTIEILYTFIKYKYSIKPNSYQNNIEIIVSIFKGLVTVEDLNTKFCILHALIKSFVNNPLKIEKITMDIIGTITNTVIEKINEEQKAEEQIAEEQKTEEQKAEEQKAKYTKCKDTIFEAINNILIIKNQELQEIKKAEEKANEEQKRKEQLEKDEDTFKQNKATQKLHSFTIIISDLKKIRHKLIENTFAIAFNNNNNKYIIYYGSELKVELIERKVKKGWKKATEILEELNTFLRENTHPIHPIYYIKLDSNTNTIVNFDYNATIIWWDVTYPEIEWIHPVNSKTNILNGNDNGTFFVTEKHHHQNSKIQVNHNYKLYFRNDEGNDTYLVDIYPFYAHIKKIKDNNIISSTTNIKKNTNEKIPMTILDVIKALNLNSSENYIITPDWPIPLIGYVDKDSNTYVPFKKPAPLS